MTAANEGLDLTPQDLYENQTVAALATRLSARYAAGGLARQALAEVKHPPVTPNVLEFLEHGLRDIGAWRIPLILRVAPEVSADDIRAVLTAVTEHHDALRAALVRRAGSWEQHIADPLEFTGLTQSALPPGTPPGGAEEREAVLAILDGQIARLDGAAPMLVAAYITGSDAGRSFLALGVHGIVGDLSSRDVLLTDLFTAFGQRLAGEPIVLQPAGPSWTEWSQLCAGLATHPAVIESRDFWIDAATRATVRLAEPQCDRPPGRADLATVAWTLTAAETTELDDARRRLKSPIDDLLLAALGRVVAATAGAGVIAVDLAAPCRSVLRPEVDPRRTVGLFTVVYPVPLVCTCDADVPVRDQLAAVHATRTEVPHYGIGYGLLRHLYGPTARQLGQLSPADIHLSYAGTIPDLSDVESVGAAVQFDTDTALPVREAVAGLGHAIELRVYRSAGVLHLDWWYDTRRVEPHRVQRLAQTFATTLAALAREAIVEDELETASDELELVDLSAPDLDLGEANARH
jgi:phthiocerol/phenolphthiocerol synthesis type-I polyketide synthase E